MVASLEGILRAVDFERIVCRIEDLDSGVTRELVGRADPVCKRVVVVYSIPTRNIGEIAAES
jgi:hypothetical protein